MQGAFVILIFTIAVGLIIYAFELRHRRRHPQLSEQNDITEPMSGEQDAVSHESVEERHGADGVCCGMHLVCEKDTLSPLSDKVEYYDDEELDRFIGRDGTDYTPAEIDDFQEVLLTMRPEDVVGWARSITLRRIELPPVVRDELLMLVNEQRQH